MQYEVATSVSILPFWGVLLGDRGANLGPFWVSVWGPVSILPFLRVLLGARDADLGSLLGVSVSLRWKVAGSS